MADLPGPLTEQDLANINIGIQQAEDGMRQIELAKRAGIDVAAQEKDLEDTLRRLRTLKQVYFPGR